MEKKLILEINKLIPGSSAKQRGGLLPFLKVILSTLNLKAGSGKKKLKKEEKNVIPWLEVEKILLS